MELLIEANSSQLDSAQKLEEMKVNWYVMRLCLGKRQILLCQLLNMFSPLLLL